MLKTIRKWLSGAEEKQEVPEPSRDVKELLRANLDLVQVDIFYIDDPKLAVPPEKLVEYYRKFYDICRDREVMERIRYLINKQVRLTIDNQRKGIADELGGININGMATVQDDFVRMANSYLKEVPHEPDFNKHSII